MERSLSPAALKHKLAFAALAFFVFTIPWESSITIANIGAVSRLAGILAFVLAAYAVVNHGRFRLRVPSVFLVTFGVFLAWLLATLFWTIDTSETRGYLQTFAQLFLMAWLIWQLCSSDAARRALLQAYVLGAYVSAVNTFFQFASGAAIEGSSSLRFAASGFNANYLASTLALAIPMAWYLMSTQRRPLLYWVNLLCIPVALFAIVLTGSRGGALAALVGFSIVPLSFVRLGLLRKLGFLALLGLLAGLVFALPQDFVNGLPSLERLSETGSQISSGNLTGRGDIWAAGLEASRERTLVGFGGGTFEFAVQPHLGLNRTAHNAFISVLVEDGAVGLGLFVLLLLIALGPILRLRSDDRLLYVVLMLVLFVSLLPSTWETEKQTWFVLSILTTRSALMFARRPGAPPQRPGGGGAERAAEALP